MVNCVVQDTQPKTLQKNNQFSKLEGVLQEAVTFIERNQICETGLWQKFVSIFSLGEDGCGQVGVSWRSEYWGKMMRGASMVLKYTKNEPMYEIIRDSVLDILTCQDEQGRITGYNTEEEFTRWDLWGRKYVMLGMQYFMEICDDEALNRRLIDSMCRQADYIIDRIGPDKLDIRTCSKNWEGMNSCSILEPMVRLYKLTGNQKYFDFAEYIISTGFIQSANIIDLARQGVPPYQYPVVKAYEMMSCFEGLLEVYYITGIEKYKTALLQFGKRIMEEEISVIGCSGCTHELFDHTRVRQTQTDYQGIVQETCVTVTWMKFAASLLELSGDSDYADHIERSFYNAYMGSLNTHRVPFYRKDVPCVPQVLPFDSYSPLTADRRGRKVGGYNHFADRSFYGCCACIGAAGAGTIPEIAVMTSADGLTLQFYEQGVLTAQTPAKHNVKISVDTAYPYNGAVSLQLELAEKENFAISLRIPAWCQNATVTCGGKTEQAQPGYYKISKTWKSGDEILLNLPMQVVKHLPDADQVNPDQFACYTYGPLVLAADKRLCDPDAVLDIVADEKGVVESKAVDCLKIKEAHVCLEVPLASGERVCLIDYASAGKTWTDDSKMAAWLKVKALAE